MKDQEITFHRQFNHELKTKIIKFDRKCFSGDIKVITHSFYPSG
jgi:hypothetical protein